MRAKRGEALLLSLSGMLMSSEVRNRREDEHQRSRPSLSEDRAAGRTEQNEKRSSGKRMMDCGG